jgi:CRP/FNR family transcriptional regulator, cyclic AMP receptor protein
MAFDSMLPRFEGGDGKRRLVDLLQKQAIVGGDRTIAAEVAAAVTLQELSPGDILIRDGASDNDLFFILTGGFRIVVNGRDVAIRRQAYHVGEMAVIDSSAPRSASVIAAERSVVKKISEQEFMRLAEKYPRLWRSLAIELCHRMIERRKFHREPNLKPVVFIGSSKERLPIAEAIRDAIPVTLADVGMWWENVFTASYFALESLEAQLLMADFAVLVAGPDDEVTSRGTTKEAPRDNVIFELGLFMGALSRSRTFVFAPKGMALKIPSDLNGMTNILYDGAATDPGAAVKDAVIELVKLISSKGPK